MLLALELMGLIAAVELGLGRIPACMLRRLLALLCAAALLIVGVGLFAVRPNAATFLILLMNMYRACNMMRLERARMHEQYLRQTTVRASAGIVSLQLLILMAWGFVAWQRIGAYWLWLFATYAVFAGALVLLASTVRQVRTTRAPNALSDVSDRDLPTLTVAIPARNETDDLEACLTSLIASNYPKLEILVLDDCSQMRRTPEIIRDYAHAGVRFIAGKVPRVEWLAKNQAYQQLAEEANGELLLFAGVDVRFAPDSLRQLVTAMLHKRKDMMCVIPKNAVLPLRAPYRDPLLVQPMRYAWEIALPRRLFHRPPVLSTCWIIKRTILEAAGSFEAVSRSIVPESHFARASSTHEDGYSFMQSNEAIGITCIKQFGDQLDTALRMRYPQVHRRIELVMFVSIAELFGVAMPIVFLILLLAGRLPLPLGIGTAATTAVLVCIYMQVVRLTYGRWLLRAMIVMPLAICLDVMLLNVSMLRYEFSRVLWKGRNVCIPLMHVVDHLPSS